MKILFVHNNFPAQFRNLAVTLSGEPGHQLVAIGASTSRAIPSVKLTKYALADADVSMTHPFARRFDLECRRAEQVLYSLSSVAASGFSPDVILAHPGWGETLPLRTVFPRSKLAVYCEFYYGAKDRDLGFDSEFPEPGLDGYVGLHLKNAATLLALSEADLGISPTSWQHSTFPEHYQSMIDIAHEGVDTDVIKPNPAARLTLPGGRELTRGDEVITFVARNLEPLRGYHVFMRALPEILARRPNAQVLIVGSDGLSYGQSPPAGTTWKSIFLNEVKDQIDANRVHFLGRVSYPVFLSALQVSSAHVYLTYPFVLSWSVLEAMSSGCVVIGSDTAPVREVIRPGETGILVPFFAVDELVAKTVEVLASPSKFTAMREAARRYVVDHFDANRICIPRVRQLLSENAAPTAAARSVWPGKEVPTEKRRRQNEAVNHSTKADVADRTSHVPKSSRTDQRRKSR